VTPTGVTGRVSGVAKPTSIEEYLSALPEQRRAVIEQFRSIAREAAPSATEVIAYDMPSLRQNGRYLVSFGAFRGHYSLFPASHVIQSELGQEVALYVYGKGTFRFPESKPVPFELVRRIIRLRVREVSAGRNGQE